MCRQSSDVVRCYTLPHLIYSVIYLQTDSTYRVSARAGGDRVKLSPDSVVSLSPDARRQLELPTETRVTLHVNLNDM